MTRRVALVLVVVALGTLAVVAVSLAHDDDNPEGIQEVEITEYQGQRLGSVDDFRENSVFGVQEIDPLTYALLVDGLVSQTDSWTLAELSEFPRTSKLVSIDCVEGWSVKALWEGIPLAALFDAVDVSEGANTVIFHAVDGYTTSLPLDFVLERDLIIADRINEVVLPAANGFPFQLVAEEKWGYKWIRWLTRIELSDNADYEGFWERRGFNSDGFVNGPKFGP